MTTILKQIGENFELQVVSSDFEEKDFLLSNFSCEGEESRLDFYLLKKGKKKAEISFSVSKESVATSLPMAPFGGFFISDKLHSDVLSDFLNAIVAHLGDLKIKEAVIIQAPKPYEEYQDLMGYLLFKSHFEPKEVLSHQFFLGRKKIKKFLQQEQGKFQQRLKDAGVSIETSTIGNFYFLQHIKSWNQQRGYTVNHDENRIIQQVSEYPDRYFLINLIKDEMPVGHCLGVKLTSDSLYYFLSAINPKMTIKYGGELMLYQLFKVAVEQKVDFIDLGSSDLGSEPNHSLLFFKSRFSNDISNKITWAKSL